MAIHPGPSDYGGDGRASESAALVVVYADIGERFLAGSTAAASVDVEAILATERMALVLCSSMTRAEIETIQQEIGIRQPFVCESGAAVMIPDGCFPFDVPCHRTIPGYSVIEFGRPYTEVVGLLRRTAARLAIPVVGFNDQSVEEVARDCELSLAHARLAKLREYDEPFRLVHPSPDERHRLWRALRAAGLCCTTTGSHEHVGAPVSKRVGISMLTNLFRRRNPSLVTAGLGMAGRSTDLLQCVQVPFVAETRVTGRTAFPLARFPRIDGAMDRSELIDTLLEVARRARQRPGPRARATREPVSQRA
jgi:mannosyl-3-phosphoglycerate phosphatase